MGDLTRRRFVTTSAGAVVGVSVFGPLGIAAAQAKSQLPSEPMVAVIRDPARGAVALMIGDREVNYRDPELVARLARAATK